MIGARLGRWVIESPLGRGGMGQVFRSRCDPPDPAMPSVAAVKVLTPELASDPGFLLRFRREIDALSLLDHPAIVRFLESGEAEGRYFYAMEYVPGPSLEKYFLDRKKVPWEEVLGLGLALAPGLKHAHDRGIVHRDLKPSNILLQELDGVPKESHTVSQLFAFGKPTPFSPKITDFGIAHVFARPHLTVTGGIIGTAEYLSPEQAAGKPVTKKSDLYSFGVVLYTLLTGRTPFEGDVMDLLQKHRFGQFERIGRLAPEIPHDFEQVINQLLAKDPQDRQGDAMVLFKQLDRLAGKYARKATQILKPGALPIIHSPLISESSGLPGPATLMSHLMRQELDRMNKGGPVARFINKPAVLISLFVLCVSLLAWGIWPSSIQTLWSKAQIKMNSDDTDDWSQAETYLEKIDTEKLDSSKRDEIDRFYQKVKRVKSQKKVAGLMGSTRNLSEAQWFYYQGFRCRQCGREEQAQKWWRDLVATFEGEEEQLLWVESAKRELANESPADDSATWKDALQESCDRVRKLRKLGQTEEASRIEQSLIDLYQAEPAASSLLAELKNKR